MNWRKAIAISFITTCFAVLGTLTVFADLLFAITLQWPVLIGIWVIGSWLLLLLRSARYDKWWATSVSLFLVALIALRFMVLNPAKPFHAFFWSISPGMASAEVRQRLMAHFPLGGRYPIPKEWKNPETGNLSFTLDPTNGSYNSEIIFLTMDGDRVKAKRYLAD